VAGGGDGHQGLLRVVEALVLVRLVVQERTRSGQNRQCCAEERIHSSSDSIGVMREGDGGRTAVASLHEQRHLDVQLVVVGHDARREHDRERGASAGVGRDHCDGGGKSRHDGVVDHFSACSGGRAAERGRNIGDLQLISARGSGEGWREHRIDMQHGRLVSLDVVEPEVEEQRCLSLCAHTRVGNSGRDHGRRGKVRVG